MIICLSACTCQPLFSKGKEYGNNPASGKYYSVRGINFYAEQYGKGLPLLLIHGNGGSINSMSDIIPYFSKKYHVIAVDSRAHGKSTDSNDSLSFEMMADDMAALLEQLKVDSVYVIGWSDGGIVALEMGLRHPEKVIKLASTGANIRPDSTALLPSLWLEEKQYYESHKNEILSTANDRNAWKVFLLDWMQPNLPNEALHNIKCPALIIAGDRDLICPEHTLQIFQNIPSARLWIVPDSGHATLNEHTTDFCKIVNDFFIGKR